MLQNRLDPLGNIIKTEARGSWMGNRGVLHDDHKNLVRSFKLKAWITCVLKFKNRKREVMMPNRYTELFSLDEATAFAAGHRPCFECRRGDFNRFKKYWIEGNPEFGLNIKDSINEIDNVLHRERIGARGEKVMYTEELATLPDGSFILIEGKPFLVSNQLLYPWTPFGYEPGLSASGIKSVTVLTPRSTVHAFEAGYVPQIAAVP